MTPPNDASTARPDELTCELIAEVQHAREGLREVCDAIDELRESIDRITRGYRQDDWQPVQRRPIVSFPVDPCDPEFASKVNAVAPETLPDDLPEAVRSAVAARLRESQRPEGMDSRAEPHRYNDNGNGKPPPGPPREQRALWGETGDRDEDKAEILAADTAEAVPDTTPQKEAEPAEPSPVGGTTPLPSEDVEATEPVAAEADPDREDQPVAPLPGHELVTLMHRHNVTIAEFAQRTGITKKRIRQAREHGLSDPNAVRDWVQAIRGRDPGPVAETAAGGAYTLDEWVKFRERCLDGVIEATVLKAEFGRMKAGKQHFIETLVNTKSADQLRLMAMQRGILDARRHTKPENAAALYRGCLSSFTLGDSVSYQPMQETYEEAAERIVLGITDEQIAAERERIRKRQEEKEKGTQ